MAAKKHTLKVTILNEEYSIRSDTPPEHARAVAQYLDQAIRKVMSSGAVVESNRAVVLAAGPEYFGQVHSHLGIRSCVVRSLHTG